MTPKGKQFARLVRKWRQRFWLNQWIINIREEKPEPSPHGNGYPALAEVVKNPEYSVATINLDAEVAKEHDADGLDQTACHEIIHLVLAPFDEAYDKITDGQLSPERRDVASLWWCSAKERVTTHLERVVREMCRRE